VSNVAVVSGTLESEAQLKVVSDMIAIIALVVGVPAAILFVAGAWIYHGLNLGFNCLKSIIARKGGNERVVDA